ncbi:MAG: hypothetical protein PHW60_10560 [Kiritimatiellae bacterium]|nr:hypothetical protein [Kiritimatiellia bacterium]
MAKRLTASDKWEDPWFRTLSLKSKLFWLFLLDRCDGAGFWKIDYDLCSFCIGETVDESILADFDIRIEKINDDKLWVVRFVEFQYGALKEDANPHKPVIKLLAKYGLLQRVEDGLRKGSGRDAEGLHGRAPR